MKVDVSRLWTVPRRRPDVAGQIRASLARTRSELTLAAAELDEHLADIDRVADLAAELPVYPDRLAQPRGTTTAGARA